MPVSIVETSDGVVLISNGIDPVLQWDGYATETSIAGVAPPYVDFAVAQSDVTSNEQPTLGSSGAGTLEGTYRIAVRYVDSNGNYSDLSLFSDEHTAVAAAQFDFGNLPTPDQPTVVRRQILRNLDGEQGVFYVDIDTTDLGSATLTSTRDDDDLAAQEAVPLFDTSDRDIANIWTPPPSYKPFTAWHQQRMYYAGIQPYTDGSIRVAAASNQVYGLNTEWKATMVNRYLYFDGATQPYLITAVDVANQILTIDSANDAGELRYAAYSIKPGPDEDNTFYWSEANRPTAVPRVNAFILPRDGDDVTGMMNFQSFLFFLKRRKMYRLTTRTDPLTDGNVYLGINRGCVNNRCWVIANEVAYLLDEGGVYAFLGGTEGRPMSPNIQDLFRRDDLTKYAINWSAAKNFHASLSPQEEVIRWFVCIGGDSLPRTALCFGYTTQRWWIEQYQHPVGASCTGRTAGISGSVALGQETVYLGTYGNKILAMTPVGLDGVVAANARRGTVTASSSWLLTVKGAALPSLAGATVSIVKGRGMGQTRRIVDVDGNTLRVDRPWDVLPDENDIYQVGGIPVNYKSLRLRYQKSEIQTARQIEVNYYPVPRIRDPLAQTLRLDTYDDYLGTPRVGGRTLDAGLAARMSGEKDVPGLEFRLDGNGYQLVRADGGQEGQSDGPKAMSIGIRGVSSPARVRIHSLLLAGIAR